MASAGEAENPPRRKLARSGTRFPMSRIKKIMQQDEDVGKMNVAVPVLISRAIELFVQRLLDKTLETTKEKGSSTVTALHIKETVKSDSILDFLNDLVDKVPDVEPPKRRKKGDVDEEGAEPKPPKAKAKKAGGRKKAAKKVDNDDEDEEEDAMSAEEASDDEMDVAPTVPVVHSVPASSAARAEEEVDFDALVDSLSTAQ